MSQSWDKSGNDGHLCVVEQHMSTASTVSTSITTTSSSSSSSIARTLVSSATLAQRTHPLHAGATSSYLNTTDILLKTRARGGEAVSLHTPKRWEYHTECSSEEERREWEEEGGGGEGVKGQWEKIEMEQKCVSGCVLVAGCPPKVCVCVFCECLHI